MEVLVDSEETDSQISIDFSAPDDMKKAGTTKPRKSVKGKAKSNKAKKQVKKKTKKTIKKKNTKKLRK